MLRLSSIVILLLFINFVNAQEAWNLKRNQDGIEVYTRKLGNEKYKEIRVITTFNASQVQLVKVLKDVEHHKEWVYNAKRAYLLSKKGPDTIYYYMEASLPWPASNRDMVTQLTFHFDTGNVLRITALGVSGIVPLNKTLIRIPYSLSEWTVTALNKKQIKIEYVIKINPGGSIPPWLVNYTASIAPYNSFKKLRQRVEATFL